uniref:Uncharacterized protein n=1 Tax=Amphora coffeiformis TaxID=265554 RepID=A0A7S3P6T4_9STRA|mmetsp:Transcript_14818/g.28228  ORF Transcript_14818/g.28228 Transcript_14818/m.28228 type:complete len:197 (+) Transcript_14818:70-660(+)
MLNHLDDPLPQKLYQVSMDTFYRADTLCRKSERNAKLAVKKLQARRVKKAFGLEYMTLLEKEASPEQLDKCMRDGHEKIDLINKDIRALRAEKASLDDELKRKLAHGTEHADAAEHEHAVPSGTQTDANNQQSEASNHMGKETATDQKQAKKVEPSQAKMEAGEGMEFAVPPRVGEVDDEEEFVVLAADEPDQRKE